MRENSSSSRRIAIFAPSAPPLSDGGIASHHATLAKLLRQRGHKVKVYTFAETEETGRLNENPDEILRGKIPFAWVKLCRLLGYAVFGVAEMGRATIMYQSSDVLKCLWSTSRLSKDLKTFAPDIIIFPDQGVPHLFFEKPGDVKYIQICHHNPLRFVGISALGRTSEKDAKVAAKLEQIGLQKIDAVVCPSHYMREFFRNSFHFQGEIQVIPNLLDEEMIRNVKMNPIRLEIGLSERAPLISIPSAGSPIKGAEFVPDLIQRINDAFDGEVGFYLSGDVSSIEKRLGRISGDIKVHAPGRLTNEAHLAVLKNCDLCVSPTLVENFSMALLEAKALGQFIISFDVGGNRDVVDGTEVGELVPPYDVGALVATTVKALKRGRKVKGPGSTLDQSQTVDRYIGLMEKTLHE